LICDSGERYLDSYFNPDWVAVQGLAPEPFSEQLENLAPAGKR